MSQEGQLLDKKSLRTILGRSADWNELAKDCVAFTNASGGRLLLGIEDGHNEPPLGQEIPADLPDMVKRKLAERTVNVTVLPNVLTAPNDGSYIELTIPRSMAVASTTDGRYFLRIADQSKPITGDDVMRLATDRRALPWETQITQKVPRAAVDEVKVGNMTRSLRASRQTKASVQEKSDSELLDHYLLAKGAFLTHMGILCVGIQRHRAELTTAPVIQFIKYNEREEKVNKLVWDDHALNPMELIDAIWQGVPDFRETYELPDGMYRQHIPAFDEVVIRELLVNALVHRPYTQRGDIFLKLYIDRLEIVNPGPLPLGVTPQNVLHTTVRRNEHLARLFHDLQLMEREGSGFDNMFEKLLSKGRPAPRLVESHDRVEVTIYRRIIQPGIIRFIETADKTYQLTQRERITLGLLAQHDSLTARELISSLELDSAEALHPWIRRLLDAGLVNSQGRTQGTRYFVNSEWSRSAKAPEKTTTARITLDRLAELIRDDVERYPMSAIAEIRHRIAGDIHPMQIKRALDDLVEREVISATGANRWRRYSFNK